MPRLIYMVGKVLSALWSLVSSFVHRMVTAVFQLGRPSVLVLDEGVEHHGGRGCYIGRNGLPILSLYRTVADNNALQPSKEQLENALTQSRSYWHYVTAVAYTHHGHGVKLQCVNPQRMLWKVPRMRGNAQCFHVMYLGASSSQALCVQASATWQPAEPPKCERVQKDKTQIILLQVGTAAAVPYVLDGCSFSHWIGTADEVCVGPNYLAILTIGWCYILSARMVEIQGEGAIMKYTATTATQYNETSAGVEDDIIDIGEADEEKILWWSAVLAPGEGWKAIIRQCDGKEFLAPWSLTSICKQSLSFKWKGKDSPAISCGPCMSSKRAFEILSEFALFHNLGSQFLVALAAALTVPTHSYHGTTFRLPYPTPTGGRCPATPTGFIPAEWAMLYRNLDYYISLSCNPEAIISSLCGTFWESGVPCNLVSPWLHPILNEIPEQQKISGVPGLYAEILGIIGGIRRPTISALWLGAVASGLAPVILRRIGRGRPPLDAIAFPWAGSPQSFVDIAGAGPYLIEEGQKEIWRADVWRLLHLPPTEDDDDLSFNYRPGTPWEPCGKMNMKDCALRVLSHLNCERHQLDYHHFTWELKDGRVIQDEGFSRSVTPSCLAFSMDTLQTRKLHPLPYMPLDQEASEEASLEIFRWFVINGEGVPPESIYSDKWLEELKEDEEDNEEIEEDDNLDSDTARRKRHSGLGNWLDTIS